MYTVKHYIGFLYIYNVGLYFSFIHTHLTAYLSSYLSIYLSILVGLSIFLSIGLPDFLSRGPSGLSQKSIIMSQRMSPLQSCRFNFQHSKPIWHWKLKSIYIYTKKNKGFSISNDIWSENQKRCLLGPTRDWFKSTTQHITSYNGSVTKTALPNHGEKLPFFGDCDAVRSDFIFYSDRGEILQYIQKKFRVNRINFDEVLIFRSWHPQH